MAERCTVAKSEKGTRALQNAVSFQERESVARRHDPAPAILVIDAGAAHAEGVRFFQAGPLFLVENVPAKFLSLR